MSLGETCSQYEGSRSTTRSKHAAGGENSNTARSPVGQIVVKVKFLVGTNVAAHMMRGRAYTSKARREYQPKKWHTEAYGFDSCRKRRKRRQRCINFKNCGNRAESFRRAVPWGVMHCSLSRGYTTDVRSKSLQKNKARGIQLYMAHKSFTGNSQALVAQNKAEVVPSQLFV